MRILILTGKFGMGHWSASQSLAQQMLRAFPDAEIEVEDFVAYAMPNASEAMYKWFNLLVTHGSALFNAYYKLTENGATDGRPAFEWVFLDRLAQLLAERCPDAVVATHPLCAQLVSRHKWETGNTLPLITCVTDLSAHSEWINRHTDCYMVGSTDIREELCAKGVERERICVTGIPVAEPFHHLRRRAQDGTHRLLIMGGGLGLLPRKESFYEGLNAMAKVKTTLITGGNQKLYHKLVGKYENIEVLGFTDRVYEYMAQSDLILSKPGGITLFESIFAELPMLAWEPFLEQEKNNADFLCRRGLGRIAAKDAEDCLRAIRALIGDRRALNSMARNMRLVKNQMEEESLDRIMTALVQGRQVSAR